MLKIKRNAIWLTRGDSAYITFLLTDREGNPVNLTENDVVSCQVRSAPNTGTLLFQGEIIRNINQGDDGTYTWHITPSNTRDLAIGQYYYDVQVETQSGDVFTFIEASPFHVTDEVTYEEEQP